MSIYKVALIQMDIILGQAEENRKRALKFIDEASVMGANIIALPELWTTGYDLNNIDRLAYEEGNTTLELLSEKAKELKINIFTGSILELENEKIYNTCYFINPNGEVLEKYRKIHLFGLMKEDRYLAPGEHVSVFSTEFAKVGMQICYDFRFPELSRKMALEGAEAFFIPAEFPHPRRNHWRILNLARAVENQVFVFAINRVGKDGKTHFFGSSMIISPWGEILAEGGEEEEIVIAEVDFALVDKVRRSIPCYKDRRPELY